MLSIQTSAITAVFRARPQRIIGNVALASLLAGAPLGAGLALLAGLMHAGDSALIEWAQSIGSGLLFGAYIVFTTGLIFIALPLAVLRRLGYGGPFFVYAISGVLSLLTLPETYAVLVFSMPASYVFCRYAYRGLGDSGRLFGDLADTQAPETVGTEPHR